MKVLVTGAGGMVGQALSQHCNLSGDEVLCYSHSALDITAAEAVRTVLERDQPEVVINCAALTDVDGCERNAAQAHATNAMGPENLARGCRKIEAGFITISTDYVFDGRKDGFYTQRDDPNPQGIYAKSKLEGERQAQLAYARTIVVRSGFIFGPGGRNFLSTVVDHARGGRSLKAIKDARGTPTYSGDLAAQLRRLAVLDLPGIYHVVNGGEGVSYEEFVWAVLEDAGIEGARVEGITMSSLNRAAPRPRNSRLKCLLSPALGLPPLPFWREALRDFVAVRSGNKIVSGV